MPTNGTPTSVKARQLHLRRGKKDSVTVPPSALNLLCTNKQMSKEAIWGFYHENDFVFSTPEHLLSFLSSLSNDRLDCTRNLTVFYTDIYVKKPSDSRMKNFFSQVLRLKCLRKFHMLFNCNRVSRTDRRLSDGTMFPGHLPGASLLFTLRSVTDIDFRYIGGDYSSSPVPSKKRFKGTSVMSMLTPRPRAGLVAAFRHLTNGLQMVQKGLVVSKLYTDEDWHKNELWPVLEGSDCGIWNGCKCGKPEDPFH